MWIPHFRSTVRRVLHDCSLCKRRQIKPQPKRSLASGSTIHKSIILDLYHFEPIMVKHSRKHEERYGCVFTCLVTRAIQLEAARSLETDLFINALRSFVARRGPPSDIYSDNGTNFVGVDREIKQSLQEWNQSQIADFLSQNQIQAI